MSRFLALFLLPLAFVADFAAAADGASRPLNWNAIGMFLVFVLFTLGITRWAALRTRSASDFYTAGGGMTGFQNGLAIAGDMISAASFLGISAMMFLNGYDGLLYALGVLAGWPIILFLIAERLRNLGNYTFADVVSYRLEQTPVRLTSAFGTLTVALMYLVAQMVGAGKLIELLFGIDYLYAVMLVGVLMVFYVTFGGMLATTWVQIIKAVMLLFGTTFMAFMVLKHFGFSTEAMFAGATAVHAKGNAIMAPGGLLSNPIDAISLGLGMMFGTAGLPHILMRFFTVSDAKEARKSVFYATGFIGYFYLLLIIVGFGAIVMVGTDPAFRDANGAIIGGGNMIAVHLAQAVGGNLFLGFISAVAFATILAVVAGLALSGASAVSHDLYACVMRKGQATRTAGNTCVADRHAVHRCPGDHPRPVIRIAEHCLPLRSGAGHRRVGEFPGAVPLDVLERPDHSWCGDRQPGRADLSDCPAGAEPGGVGQRAASRQGAVPLLQPGVVLHEPGVLQRLVIFGHRHVPACSP